MRKTVLFCILSPIGNFAANASAQTLSCDVSFLTGDAKSLSAKGLSTRFHSAAEHPGDPFFHFSIAEDVSDELYLHQNLCIRGKDVGDPKLKGTLCLLVSSGSKLLNEPGRIPDEDLYLSATGKVLTFQIFQSSRRPSSSLLSGQTYINSASEVALPVTGFRGSFEGARAGGLSTLTITCR